MGKRKKASKPMGPKRRENLATAFQCLFCNHENSVTVRMEKKLGLGDLSCKICGQSFQTTINYLSAPVDVYSDWVDACDAVAKSEGTDAVGQAPRAQYREIDVSARAPAAMPSRQLIKKPTEMDDFIEDDEPDGEADFDDVGGDDDD